MNETIIFLRLFLTHWKLEPRTNNELAIFPSKKLFKENVQEFMELTFLVIN